ncbi:hypothetical protein WP5S18E01_16670 [Enterobacter cloacae]|nr:hypothetical protein WP5S18E01_16670 [Enterobacter cloacae]
MHLPIFANIWPDMLNFQWNCGGLIRGRSGPLIAFTDGEWGIAVDTLLN